MIPPSENSVFGHPKGLAVPFLDRNVGEILLLRHEIFAGLLHDEAAYVHASGGLANIRALHGFGLFNPFFRGNPCRSDFGSTQGRDPWRGTDGDWPFL